MHNDNFISRSGDTVHSARKLYGDNFRVYWKLKMEQGHIGVSFALRRFDVDAISDRQINLTFAVPFGSYDL